jgi:hypothetical protein
VRYGPSRTITQLPVFGLGRGSRQGRSHAAGVGRASARRLDGNESEPTIHRVMVWVAGVAAVALLGRAVQTSCSCSRCRGLPLRRARGRDRVGGRWCPSRWMNAVTRRFLTARPGASTRVPSPPGLNATLHAGRERPPGPRRERPNGRNRGVAPIRHVDCGVGGSERRRVEARVSHASCDRQLTFWPAHGPIVL